MTILIAVGLALLAVALVIFGPPQGVDAGMWGTIVGAMLGAAAAMFGANLERRQSKADKDAEEATRRTKVKMLVASELVNVTAGLLYIDRLLNAALKQIDAGGGHVPGIDLTESVRPTPWTDGLGTDLLVLSEREIDVLSTLRANLAATQESLEDIADAEGSFGPLAMTRQRNSVTHTMRLLADAFDAVAPTRKLELPGQEPELATVLLRRQAGV